MHVAVVITVLQFTCDIGRTCEKVGLWLSDENFAFGSRMELVLLSPTPRGN